MLTLTPLAGFVVAFLVSWLLTPLVRTLARRAGAVDWRTPAKIHARDIPRLGGIAIALGFLVPVLVLMLRRNLFQQVIYQEPARIAALLGGGLVILGLGVWDDFRSATATKKLAVQIPVAVMAWWLGIRIGATSGPSGQLLEFSTLTSLAVTVSWLVVAINAMNLIDGLDGLASGIALQALAATALCAFHRGEPALALFAICLAGSVGGFLIHNFQPATIFMGDSGSMFLGYVLGVAAIWSSQKTATALGVFLPAIALGLPLLDTTLAVSRRLLSGQPVLSGDLGHVHHRLLAVGWSTRKAVIALYGVALFYGALSVLLIYLDNSTVRWVLLALGLACTVAFARWLGFLRSTMLQAAAHERRTRHQLRAAVDELKQRLRDCAAEEEVARAVAHFEAIAAPLLAELADGSKERIAEVVAESVARVAATRT